MTNTNEINKIPESIREAHRGLSDASARFLEYAWPNPDVLKRSSFSHVTSFQGDYLPTQPWPTFINSKLEEEFRQASVSVYNLIKSIPQRIFSFNAQKMAEYYNYSLSEVKSLLFGVDDAYIQRLISRGDFVFSPEKGLKCIEFNVQANLGGWELDILEDLYINVPVVSTFLKEQGIQLQKNRLFDSFFNLLAEEGVKHYGDQPGTELNIAICYPAVVDYSNSPIAHMLQQIYQRNLKRYGGGIRGDLMVCNTAQVNAADGRLRCRGKDIHSLVEMDAGRIPEYFMEIVDRGNLLLYNGPISKILSNKLNLALCWEYHDSGLFSKKERDIIDKYIPWTRKINPSLKDYILKNKDNLVLKPPDELGGIDVMVGRYSSGLQWEKTLQKALNSKNWVVQEWLNSYRYMYQSGEYGCTPHSSVWGLFAFGDSYVGGFVRILPDTVDNKTYGKGVINSHLGAEESTLLVVSE